MAEPNVAASQSGSFGSIVGPDATTPAELAAVFNDQRLGIDFVCEANGITREEFVAGKAAELRSLELFLLVIPRCPPLKYFANLTHLKLLHLGMTKMEHLDCLPHLKCLWLGENDITVIEGLEKCKELQELYLNSNLITKIEGLSQCTKMRVLWLQTNEIEVLEGLDTLTELRSICVAANKISTLGNAFAKLTKLEEINVSANRLSSFREILPLADLPALERLWLSDAVYGANPLCTLCNYQTFTLFTLRSLKLLDYQHISPDQRTMAESTFQKKKIYYNMRIKTLKRNARSIIRKADQVRMSKEGEIQLVRSLLLRCLHEIDAELSQFHRMPKSLDEVPLDGSELPVVIPDKGLVGALRNKKANVQTHLDRLSSDITRLRALQDLLVDRAALLANGAISRLMLELHTGGNVRLEDGKVKEVWYQSCAELLRTRFFPADFESFGVKELRVTRVSKIQNRTLRTQFDTALERLVDTSDPGYKRALEYLFLVECNGTLSDNELYTLMEFGVTGAPSKPLGITPPPPPSRAGGAAAPTNQSYVALTNSVFVAEHQRLQKALRAGELLRTKSMFENPHLTGRLIVAKAFLGLCSPEANPFVPSGPEVPLTSVGINPADYPEGTTTVYRAKQGDSRQRVWFGLDPALVLPEYVVEFGVMLNPSAAGGPVELFEIPKPSDVIEVVTKAFPKALPVDIADLRNFAPAFIGFAQCCTAAVGAIDRDEITKAVAAEPSLPKRSLAVKEGIASVHQLATYLASRSGTPTDAAGYTVPSEEHEKRAEALIKTLDTVLVIGAPLLGFQAALLNLFAAKVTKLVLPFNELSTIDFVAGLPSLTHLDLSHNVLRKMEGLKPGALLQLKTLRLESNLLYRVDEAQAIVESCPAVELLTVSGNPVSDVKAFIDALILGAKQLKELDAVGGVVDKVRDALLARPDTLDIVSAAAAILSQGDEANIARRRVDLHECPLPLAGHPPPLKNTIDDSIDASKLLKSCTALSARGQRVATVTCLSQAPALRMLDLGDNRIAEFGRLGEAKPSLEALVLDGNLLWRIDEALRGFDMLRRLDLSRNQLTRLDGVDGARNLTFLSAEGNSISSLAPLAELTALSELYLSSNRIASSKEVLHLRSLPRLIIADFSNNACAEEDHYRLYTVFQLKKLKVLDGSSIDAAEQAQAKDVYAGRISSDLLMERIDPPGAPWSTVTELSLGGCGIKEVTLLDEFPVLQHLALDRNLLIDIAGLTKCTALVSLDLSFNKLGLGPVPIGKCLSNAPYLESISLEGNALPSIAALQLDLPKLKFLNLKANEIQRIDGLDHLPSLRELILDRNKLRAVDVNCFAFNNFLRCLSCDENAIKTIEGTRQLQHLQRISFGSNRIAEINDIVRAFESAKQITEATFMANQAARKNLYRISLVHAFPLLATLDSKEVTIDEKERAEQYFAQETQMAMIPPHVLTDVRPVMGAQQQVMAGIAMMAAANAGVRAGLGAPLRVMNMDAIGMVPPEVQAANAAQNGGQYRMGRPAVAAPGRGGMPNAQRTSSADLALRPRPKPSVAQPAVIPGVYSRPANPRR